MALIQVKTAPGAKSIRQAIVDLSEYYSIASIQSKIEPHQKEYKKDTQRIIKPLVPVRRGPYPPSYQPLLRYGYIFNPPRKPGDTRKSVLTKSAKKNKKYLRRQYVRMANFATNFLQARKFRGRYARLKREALQVKILPRTSKLFDAIAKVLDGMG